MRGSMKVLVTGGCGYVGSTVADFLRAQGFSVRIFGRHLPAFLESWARNFEVSIGDVCEKQSMRAALQNVDAVVHCAALNETETNSSEEAFKVNALGTKNILEVASELGIKRVIKLSTFHIYGRPTESIVTEKTPACPLTDYAQSQYFSEMFCRQFTNEKNMFAVVLRCSNGYGVPIRPNIERWTLAVSDFCRQATLNKKIILKSTGLQRRDFVWLQDIASFIKILLDTPEETLAEIRDELGLTFNVGGDDVRSIKEVAEVVANIYKTEFGEKIELSIPTASGADITNSFEFNSNKAKNLGYLPSKCLEKEIKDLLLFCRQHDQDIRNISSVQ